MDLLLELENHYQVQHRGIFMEEYDRDVDQSQLWCTRLASGLKFGRL